MSNVEEHRIIRSFMSSAMDFLQSEDRSGDPSKISVLPLSYNCPRRRFIYYQEIKEPHYDLKTVNNFLKGRLYHLIPVFPNGEHELELIWEGIVGHPDDYDPVHKILVDKKFTENPPRKSKYAWEDPLKEPSPPRPHHTKQVEYYKVLLEEGKHFDGTPSNRPVKSAYVLYKKISDTGYMAMASKCPLRNTETIKQEMRKRRDEFKQSIVSNKIPDGELSWECGYCDFYSNCMDKKYVKKWGDTWL